MILICFFNDFSLSRVLLHFDIKLHKTVSDCLLRKLFLIYYITTVYLNKDKLKGDHNDKQTQKVKKSMIFLHFAKIFFYLLLKVIKVQINLSFFVTKIPVFFYFRYGSSLILGLIFYFMSITWEGLNRFEEKVSSKYEDY